jgi:hypothetical protein
MPVCTVRMPPSNYLASRLGRLADPSEEVGVLRVDCKVVDLKKHSVKQKTF